MTAAKCQWPGPGHSRATGSTWQMAHPSHGRAGTPRAGAGSQITASSPGLVHFALTVRSLLVAAASATVAPGWEPDPDHRTSDRDRGRPGSGALSGLSRVAATSCQCQRAGIRHATPRALMGAGAPGLASLTPY